MMFTYTFYHTSTHILDQPTITKKTSFTSNKATTKQTMLTISLKFPRPQKNQSYRQFTDVPNRLFPRLPRKFVDTPKRGSE